MDAAGDSTMSVSNDALNTLFQTLNITGEQVKERFPDIAAAQQEAAKTGNEVTLTAKISPSWPRWTSPRLTN